MTARRIAAELDVVASRLMLLRQEITSLEQWEMELRTTLKVLQRLGDEEPAQVDRSNFSATEPTMPVTLANSTGNPSPQRRRQITPAKGLAAVAGQAVTAMLRERGTFMRPMEVVHLLRDQHGITIGLGKPGRETSDLSAAIGHGKVAELTVSRQDGWGLTEWNGVPPAGRESTIALASETPIQQLTRNQAVGVEPSAMDDAHEPHLTDGGIVGR